MMNIKITNHQTLVRLEMYKGNKNFIFQEFLIDTGCMESFVFVTDEKGKIFQEFNFYDIEKFPKEHWIIVADGRRVKTFSAKLLVKIEEETEVVTVLIIEGVSDEIPVIGMKFLEGNEKILLIDCKNKKFQIT